MEESNDIVKYHTRRVEKYEAYLVYRKYYKEIFQVLCSYDDYPSESSGGAGYLFDAILNAIPKITREQLSIIWPDIPLVLEKRTQRYIEVERQNSLKCIAKYLK